MLHNITDVFSDFHKIYGTRVHAAVSFFSTTCDKDGICLFENRLWLFNWSEGTEDDLVMLFF